MSEILNQFKTVSVISTGELARFLNFDTTYMLKKLIKMEKLGLIKKVGKIALNKSYIWEIKNEVNNG